LDRRPSCCVVSHRDSVQRVVNFSRSKDCCFSRSLTLFWVVSFFFPGDTAGHIWGGAGPSGPRRGPLGTARGHLVPVGVTGGQWGPLGTERGPVGSTGDHWGPSGDQWGPLPLRAILTFITTLCGVPIVRWASRVLCRRHLQHLRRLGGYDHPLPALQPRVRGAASEVWSVQQPHRPDARSG
jgi:hypothetical protein